MNYVEIPNSSQISRVGYDCETKEMSILFKSGAEYIYSDVPEDFVNGMIGAESCGKYFNQYGRGFKFIKK